MESMAGLAMRAMLVRDSAGLVYDDGRGCIRMTDGEKRRERGIWGGTG